MSVMDYIKLWGVIFESSRDGAKPKKQENRSKLVRVKDLLFACLETTQVYAYFLWIVKVIPILNSLISLFFLVIGSIVVLQKPPEQSILLILTLLVFEFNLVMVANSYSTNSKFNNVKILFSHAAKYFGIGCVISFYSSVFVILTWVYGRITYFEFAALCFFVLSGIYFSKGLYVFYMGLAKFQQRKQKIEKIIFYVRNDMRIVRGVVL